MVIALTQHLNTNTFAVFLFLKAFLISSLSMSDNTSLSNEQMNIQNKWLLKYYKNIDNEITKFHHPIVISFSKKNVLINDGCNKIVGDYEIENDKLYLSLKKTTTHLCNFMFPVFGSELNEVQVNFNRKGEMHLLLQNNITLIYQKLDEEYDSI